MNNRIIELMLEAGKTIPEDKHIDADLCEVFAKLIVQECANTVIDRCEMRAAEDVKRAEYHAKRIKEHFGIKE